MGDGSSFLYCLDLGHPGVLEHLGDGQTVVDIAVQHLADQIDAGFGEGKEGDAQGLIEDFVDVVEWVLLVDDRVQQDTQSPDILFLAAVGFALEDLGGCVIYSKRISWLVFHFVEIGVYALESLPIVPTKTSNGPFLMYAALPKSINLIRPSPSSTTFSSLMSR